MNKLVLSVGSFVGFVCLSGIDTDLHDYASILSYSHLIKDNNVFLSVYRGQLSLWVFWGQSHDYPRLFRVEHRYRSIYYPSNICIMLMGLDGEVDGWMSSKLNGPGTHVSEDCFGPKFWQTEPLMLDAMDANDDWNNVRRENENDFDFDILRENGGAEEARDGLCNIGNMVPLEGDANPHPYDASADSFIPVYPQPSVDASNHDSTHGYQGSPRESSLSKKDVTISLPDPVTKALEPVGVMKRTSRRTRKLPQRLLDSVTSLHTSSTKSLQTAVSVSQGKSYLSDQMSSSDAKNSKQSRNRTLEGKGVVDSKGSVSLHTGKVRGAQAIRATSARTEMKGRPSFAELVTSGIMKPGVHKFSVGHTDVSATVGEDGAINYDGCRYRAVSKFALTVLRMRNPARQSCDGWKEVSWNGEKLDKLRVLCLRRQNSSVGAGHEHF